MRNGQSPLMSDLYTTCQGHKWYKLNFRQIQTNLLATRIVDWKGVLDQRQSEFCVTKFVFQNGLNNNNDDVLLRRRPFLCCSSFFFYKFRGHHKSGVFI